MANNRMYLINRRTGVKIYLAKYYPSSGWYTNHEDLGKYLNEEFAKSDFGHLTPDQRRERLAAELSVITNQPAQPYPDPYYANYDREHLLFGDQWELEYECESKPKDRPNPP